MTDEGEKIRSQLARLPQQDRAELAHFLIQSNAALQGSSAPDYLLLFAWSFLPEIARKCSGYLDRGGRMIVPLPNVQMVMYPTPGLPL